MYNFRLCIYNFVIYPVISNYDLFFLSLYEKKKGIDFIVKRKYFSLKMFEFYLYIYKKSFEFVKQDNFRFKKFSIYC